MSIKRAAIELSLITSVTLLAFKGRQKKDARKNATGICQDCGTNVGRENTIFGHLNHDPKAPGYNSVEKNGVERCKICEARYHLIHVDNPQQIGMSSRDALATAWGHLTAMDEPARSVLEQEHPGKVNYLRKKLRL